MKAIKDLKKNDIVISIAYNSENGLYMKAYKVGTPDFHKVNLIDDREGYAIRCMRVNCEDDMTDPRNFEYTDDLFGSFILDLENTRGATTLNRKMFIHEKCYDTRYQLEAFKETIEKKLKEIKNDYEDQLHKYNDSMNGVKDLLIRNFVDMPVEKQLYEKGNSLIYVPSLFMDDLTTEGLLTFWEIKYADKTMVNNRIHYSGYAFKSFSAEDDIDAYMKYDFYVSENETLPHTVHVFDQGRDGCLFNSVNKAKDYIRSQYVYPLEDAIRYLHKEIDTYDESISRIDSNFNQIIETAKKLNLIDE